MSKPKETEQPTATFSESEDYDSAEESLSFSERIDAILSHATQAVRRTLSQVAVRDLDNEPNKGITETTFKLLLMQAIMDAPLWESQDGYPPLRIHSEFQFPGGTRADLVIFEQSPDNPDVRAHIVELKYFRTGFIANYTSNHRRFHINMRTAATQIEAMSAEELKAVKCRQKFAGDVTKMVSVQKVLDEAEGKQCESYMNLMRMKYGKSLRSISAQVVFGVSRRILVGEVLQ